MSTNTTPWLCTVVALALTVCAACDKADDAATSNAAAGTTYLVASGDTAGWITPCGCAANQSGGLLRRGTYLNDLRNKGGVVYVDVGGAAGGNSDYHKVKFEAILAGEKQMQIAAHNLGRSELAMGAAYLKELAKRGAAPFISANAVDPATGERLVDSHRVVDFGGKKIAVVGVASTKYAGDGIRVTDPKQAVLATAGPLKGTYDALVVLAYVPDDELQPLAAALPEADVVLGGPTGQAVAPQRVGPTVLAAATNKGKFLVQLERDATAGWTGSIAEMGPKLADHDAQTANVRAYLAVLTERDFTAQGSGLAPPVPADAPPTYRVAGSAACLSCHTGDHAQWAQSKHSHAWEALEQKQFHVDPYCMQCHTTGFGLPGGFESRTRSASLVGVGCESCHGPSLAHVQKPTVRTAFAAADQCVRCHDHENSPTFVYGTYWPRIQHGKTKTALIVGPAEEP
jgi:hypothetical protein